MTEKKTKTAAYARVSNPYCEEQYGSFVAQSEVYKEMILADPTAELVGIYADRKSGKETKSRPQFMQMMAAARRGEIERIITKSIARFGRNILETLKIVQEFRERGISIYFEKENIETLDATSDLMLSLYSTVAENELKNMSENIKWRIRQKFEDGEYHLKKGYGFTDGEDGQWVVVPHEAEVIREVFTRYLNGEGLRAIATDLNKRGLKTREGGIWRPCSMRSWFFAERLIGDLELQKTHSVNFKRVKNNGEVPRHYFENHHPPIIDESLYYAVQDRYFAVGAEHKNKTTLGTNPFSRKIKCGECGKHYSRRLQTQKGKRGKMTYNCQTYFGTGREYCGGKNILEIALHECFVAAYNNAAQHEKSETKTGQLTDGIQTLFARERELVVLRAKGYISKDAYESERATIVAHIADLEDALQKALIIANGASFAKLPVTEFSDTLVDALDYAVIDDEDITFHFYNGATSTHKFFTTAQKHRFEYHKAKRLSNLEQEGSLQEANENE